MSLIMTWSCKYEQDTREHATIVKCDEGLRVNKNIRLPNLL